MKLRMQANSIRLRLKKGEVEQLARSGCVEEKICFGENVFHYVLEASRAVTAPGAHLKEHGILVQLPVETATRWAAGDEVGIEAFQVAGKAGQLQILIEKDFACLNGNEDQNVDTFPNPLAGTKC